eukprot:187029_1
MTAPHEDVLNLHTYDGWDWILFTFIILSLFALNIAIGCCCHRKMTKYERNANHLSNELANHILPESQISNSEKMEQKSIDNDNVIIIHKTTTTKLTTIQEAENESETDNEIENDNNTIDNNIKLSNVIITNE